MRVLGKLPRLTALIALLAAAGCAGLSAIDTASCGGQTGNWSGNWPGNWQCVKSAPVFAGLNSNNNPHTPDLPDSAAIEYDRRHLALVAADRKRRIETANGIGPAGQSAHARLNAANWARYRTIKAAANVTGGRTPPFGRQAVGGNSRLYDRRWRVARQVVYLGGRPLAGRNKQFYFSAMQATTTEISFRSIAPAALAITGRCDGPAELRRHRTVRTLAANEAFSFNLAAGNRDRLASRLSPGKHVRQCILTVTGKNGYADRITLARDKNRLGIDGRYDVCAAPPLDGLSRLEQVFYADRWLSQTCVMKRQHPKFLSRARDGFNAKVEMLLGRRLTHAFFDKGDPEAPLDFSKAPKLDFIYVSYLDIKADFSGKILERLLRHHAKLGTPVRILVTEILERDKDRALLEAMAADHPNLQLQEFRWRPARGSAYDERLSGYYKTHHIKLLATLSRQPGATRMVIGGRNLHDGFLYKEPLDLTRYPDLQTYKGTNGLSLNYYSNYTDFDIAISDPETVRTVMAHFSTVWNRDFETNVSRPFSIQTTGGKARLGTRHFISIPYADGKALEKYYIELIDAARHKIEIANPYLNPPAGVDAALERAIDRGVQITLIARVNLHGDIGGTVLTRLNQLFVEKFAGRIQMYEYLEPKVVLHTKFLMIDERLTVLSSTNLNHRSFIHDSESGIAFLDPKQYRRFKAVFETYRAGSKRLTPKVDVPAGYRLLLRSKLLLDAL